MKDLENKQKGKEMTLEDIKQVEPKIAAILDNAAKGNLHDDYYINRQTFYSRLKGDVSTLVGYFATNSALKTVECYETVLDEILALERLLTASGKIGNE